ncbi:hypothetical protein E3N88_02362 [Mikania micrantha]|uniref:Uncharacterized protein n=1 Tax=Mikania micrantha TaxID=192012 RepID=A0A5N6Q3H1_9ASTR|nr:hypothetical protein E3N88_02331 [Mikania micrantha]KAD7479226.1 hypothetical protein E3N88_02362 [Mikania micrantha]
MNLSGLTGSPIKYCFHLHSRAPAIPCKRASVFQDKGKRRSFFCLERRNNLSGSTNRYVTKRTLLVKCAMDASFGDARDESSAIFPRINVKDPYKRLGLSKDASEDEIQGARNFLVQKYAGHKPSVDAIESAHDKIIMQKFYERKNPKINVKKKMREVSQSRVVQAVTSRFRTPATNFIIKTSIAFVALAALTVFFPTEEGPTLQVAISLFTTIYFIHERLKSKLRAFLYGNDQNDAIAADRSITFGLEPLLSHGFGNVLDGVSYSTATQRAKEFRSDNIFGNVCASVGFFYLS